MVKKTVEVHGRLGHAFNNAGIVKRIPLVELTEADFDSVISINLKGVWLCMKFEILQMLKQGGHPGQRRGSRPDPHPYG